MHAIDPRFLNADGSFNHQVALEAGRDARAQAMRAGLGAISRVIRRVSRACRISAAVDAEPAIPAQNN
ncbi:MAG: hypothetical protein IH626_04075 [Rhodospirillales bacterium]|nr:hypothetical protein [Rhodospirillales bacterium]